MATKTYFCYGIPVTNESITYATMAYEHLDGPFRFIRLVQKRIREGSLQTSQPSAIGALPIELWDLVRHKVIEVELRAAERKFLGTRACNYCWQTYGRDCRVRLVFKWADLLQCDLCDKNMSSWKGFNGNPTLTTMCRAVLRDYGLDMPSTRMLKCSQPGSWHPTEGDPDSVVFVVVSPSSPADSVDAEDHVSCQQPDVDDMDNDPNDGVWHISLDKPADADQRFRHLLRDLHLTPLKVSDGTIGIARAADRTPNRTYEKISADEVKPLWHLFTIVECDSIDW